MMEKLINPFTFLAKAKVCFEWAAIYEEPYETRYLNESWYWLLMAAEAGEI